MIRTGEQYRESLRDGRQVWINGEKVKDVTTHASFKPIVDVRARIYDMAHDAKTRDVMAYVDKDSNEPCCIGYKLPHTQEDWQVKRRAVDTVMDDIGGVVIRVGDETIGEMWSLYDGRDVLSEVDPQFAENIENHIFRALRSDTFHVSANTDPKGDRSKRPQDQDPDMLLHLVKETDKGIIVRGAKYETAAAYANQAFVKPTIANWGDEKLSDYALGFICDMAAPGVKHICRTGFAGRAPARDYPLANRFDEVDTLVIFDDVLVPWERVFLLGDINLINGTGLTTGSSMHTAHQGAAKNLAKCEFVLGVALHMTQTLGNAHLPHSEERLGELMMYTELMRACMRAAEADAELDRWGVMRPSALPVEITRNLFTTAYPRMAEILQLLGSSSFMITPTEADFRTPLAPDIDQYLATEGANARERVKLFRLAWDIAGSAFGSRQVLYERFFASDPLTRARFLGAIYPKAEIMKRVTNFLERDDEAT